MLRAPLRAATAVLALTLSCGTLSLSAAAATADGGSPPAEVPVDVTRTGLGVDVPGVSEPCEGPEVVCPDRLLFGLSTPQVLKLDSRLTAVESGIGHRADLVGSYQDFTEPIYTARLKAALRSGRTPMVTWEPFYAKRPKAASYPLARIAAGRYDAYLREAARQARAVGKPFVIRFGHEMNGFWYPWGQQRPLHPQSVADPRNTPAAYVSAYRHVVDVFRAAGATNVVWMWSPNVVDANPRVTLRSVYPGDRYVDVIGLDGYLEQPADTFESRYRSTLTELAPIGRGKPVIVAETGAVVGAGRAAALGDLVASIAAEPRIVGMLYFSQPDKVIDYQIGGDQAALSVLRAALDAPRFTLGSSDGGVVARTPHIAGVPRVGEELSVAWQWRGAPERTVGSWFSCPPADSPTAGCTRLGWGSRLPLTRALRGRFVRASLGVQSPAASDHAWSPAVGPVLTVPAAVAPLGIDLLAESVRVRMPAPAEDVTRWVVRVDGGAPVHLPAATTEYHLKGLLPGSAHTVGLAAADDGSTGVETTARFTVLARPAAPSFTVIPGGYTVQLPPPAPGQTGWVAIVAGVEEELPLSTTEVTRSGLAAGSHGFGLRAVSGDARTGATYVYPQVP